MDITRNWRLKTTRTQLLATRRPDGQLVLPGQSGQLAQPVAGYQFDAAPATTSAVTEDDYAQAAR